MVQRRGRMVFILKRIGLLFEKKITRMEQGNNDEDYLFEEKDGFIWKKPPAAGRTGYWPMRRGHSSRNGPTCAVCGGRTWSRYVQWGAGARRAAYPRRAGWRHSWSWVFPGAGSTPRPLSSRNTPPPARTSATAPCPLQWKRAGAIPVNDVMCADGRRNEMRQEMSRERWK